VLIWTIFLALVCGIRAQCLFVRFNYSLRLSWKGQVTTWCTLLVERPCLHCHSSKETDALKVKLRSRDHSSTNSKHGRAEGSVTNLKLCYGESANNIILPHVFVILSTLFRSFRTSRMLRRCPTTVCCIFKIIAIISFLPLLQWAHIRCTFPRRVQHSH
jgi:hypothetical protein